MGGIARGASERAAKDVVSAAQAGPGGGYAAGVGGVEWVGGQPQVTYDPQQLQNLRMLQTLGQAQGGQALQLTPGATQFGGAAFDTSQRLLSEAGGFDPLAEAENRFARLQSVLGTQRGRQREGLESRLLAQGRLDSTGGDRLQAEMEAQFAAQDAAALDKYYGEAQAAQQQAISQGLQAGASGVTTQQSGFQQALQAQPAVEQAATAPYRFAGLMSGLASENVARLASGSGALASHNTAVAAHEGADSGGGLGSAIGGTVGALGAGYFTGWNPKAMQAGATVGSNLGSFL